MGAMVGQVPDSSMNQVKRDASMEATGRPSSQRQKAGAGVAVAAPPRDVASLQSQASEIDNAAEVEAGITALESAAKVSLPEESPPGEPAPPQPARSSEWDPWLNNKGAPGHVPQSRQKHMTSPNRSTQAVTLQGETLDLVLTLLLQS